MFYLIGLLSVIFFALAINVISKSIKLNKSLAREENTDSAVDSNNNATYLFLELDIVLTNA